MLKSLPGDSLRPQVPPSQALHHFCSAPLCPCLWNAAWMLWPLLCMGPAAPSFLSISPVPELQGPVDKNGPRSSSSAPVGVLVSKPSPAFRADWGSLPSFSAQFSLLAFRAPLSTCLPSPRTCGPCTWPSSAQGRSWTPLNSRLLSDSGTFPVPSLLRSHLLLLNWPLPTGV